MRKVALMLPFINFRFKSKTFNYVETESKHKKINHFSFYKEKNKGTRLGIQY